MSEKVVIFNGDLDLGENSVSLILSQYLSNQLKESGIEHQIVNVNDADIPLLDFSLDKTPESVETMVNIFREADTHIWLSPLYHGGIPGTMKNALDWLEITANRPKAYLTDIKVGMICWANGTQAMQGINNMDAIAKTLRAWSLPYSVPIVRRDMMDIQNPSQISKFYLIKLHRLLNIATSRKIIIENPKENS